MRPYCCALHAVLSRLSEYWNYQPVSSLLNQFCIELLQIFFFSEMFAALIFLSKIFLKALTIAVMCLEALDTC